MAGMKITAMGASRAAKLSRAGGDVPPQDSIAVDASCRGNPGPMEYRGVIIGKGREVFRQAPVQNGTNNIGEFLAIVHALVYLKEHGPRLAGVQRFDPGDPLGEAATLQYENRADGETREVFALIARAEDWLRKNIYAE